MKVFGIYEKIDGLDMIDTFNAFYECVSIYEAVKLFIKNAKTEYGIYDTENFEAVEITKEIAKSIQEESYISQDDFELFRKYNLLPNPWSNLYIKEEGKYLIEYDENYCDSFYISGFRIVENIHSWNNEVDNLSEYDYSYCFGSNEVIEYDSAEDFCNALKITKISDEQYDTIHKLFGESYGHFPI